MTKRTPLFSTHEKLGAKIVDFAGWDMPLHYGSQLKEHLAVRQHAGVFDVSHMAVVDLAGDKTRDFLRYLLANDVAKLATPGRALYSCMLNEQAGVIDDLIVYYQDDTHYRLVVNAGTREKDLAWIKKHAQAFQIEIKERTDLAMLAVQGPEALMRTKKIIQDAANIIDQLKPFSGTTWKKWFIARTGYTGEDGLEIMLPNEEASAFLEQLVAEQVAPCGLGARDTLRLEAGMNLYGTDMDEKTHPLESNLAWTIAWQPDTRDFIGRAALTQIKNNGSQYKLVGLKLLAPGIMRNHQTVVVEGIGNGEITSGGFSPTLNCSIALARVPAATGDSCHVQIRDKLLPVAVVKPNFVRHGKALEVATI